VHVTSLLAAGVPVRRPQGRGAPASEVQATSEAPGELPSAVLALAEADADAVADDLHDGALQALVVARYAADAAVRGGDPVGAREAVQAALVALRHAVWRLRPRGDKGLASALRDLALHLDATGGAPLRLDLDAAASDLDGSLDGSLAPEAAHVAYRLVQHAAGDRPLTVRVRRTPSALRVDLDTAVPDPAGETLRARAVGATLLARPDSALLLLPLLPATGTSLLPAGPPACEEVP
jgi:hypothetical protein